LARTYTGRIVFAAMCDKLVDITPELDIAPQLATEWQWVDGNKGLVLKLRQGVKFHDGEPLDAAAVKFSIERHLNMEGSNRKAEISAVSAVEIIDDHTVKLVLKAPFAPLLAALSDRAGMIVSPKAAQAAGDFVNRPVCAGPYKFVERVAQDRIVLERFADYWNKEAVKFDRIVFMPIPDSTVRLANLQSGGLDMIERLAATDLETARNDPRLKLSTITGLGYQSLSINVNNGARAKNPLGQDPRVRRSQRSGFQRSFPTRKSMGRTEQSLLRKVASRPGSRRGQGQAAARRGGCPEPSGDTDDHDCAGNDAGGAGHPVNGSRGRVRHHDPGHRVRCGDSGWTASSNCI
jgi:peptide/nickel transport system substrate-binding protein